MIVSCWKKRTTFIKKIFSPCLAPSCKDTTQLIGMSRSNGPKFLKHKPEEFMDLSIVAELEKSGFFKELAATYR